MESLSSYARQFLGQMEKPNVESIEGLSPAISILRPLTTGASSWIFVRSGSSIIWSTISSTVCLRISFPHLKTSDTRAILEALAREYDFRLDVPFESYSDEVKKILIHGTDGIYRKKSFRQCQHILNRICQTLLNPFLHYKTDGSLLQKRQVIRGRFWKRLQESMISGWMFRSSPIQSS